ncbi:uncharacterized protein LOC101857133 [Aplysia californica]|uniref:Uncharacterized protein LOC101857133 n=1 Tax=Aplysia californica TaxID=6500 RepID=A0ABM0K0K9_APLCA|nr:uncharacterized protein LOC101857133 [Aplysia californica]XP_012942190.1 uncharacterized protein LOC101857133 [Aplysia californica]XP_012942191.1 uncharacterized protein LOC101857133 [Aplysia californica]
MPQPPAATSGDTDMTQSLAAQAKPSGHLSQPRPFATPSQHRAPPPLSATPSRSSPSKALLLHDNTSHARLTRGKSRCRTNVFKQVSRLKGPLVCVFLLVLLMLLPHVHAKPWLEETPHDVTFNVPMCRPLSQADLQRMMGPAWDESRMAPDMATAKRTFAPESGGAESSINGYQGDDPRASGLTEREDLVAEEKMWGSSELWVNEREEDIYTEGGVLDGIDDNDDEDGDEGGEEEEEEVEEEEEEVIVERRTWMPRRGTRRHHSSFRDRRRFRYPKFGSDSVESNEEEEEKKRTVLSSPYGFMRRRRRSANSSPSSRRERKKSRSRDDKNHLNDDSYDDMADDNAYSDTEADDNNPTSNDEASKDNILPLRLILSGKNKKLRRQLKKKFRQKAKKLRKKDPPWECKMRHKMLFMKPGVFPRVLRQGECASNKCFYRLYNCEPSKYAITLLQRDPDHCNPIPSIGNSTVYEERWNLAKYHVTVGCNCASLVWWWGWWWWGWRTEVQKQAERLNIMATHRREKRLVGVNSKILVVFRY